MCDETYSDSPARIRPRSILICVDTEPTGPAAAVGWPMSASCSLALLEVDDIKTSFDLRDGFRKGLGAKGASANEGSGESKEGTPKGEEGLHVGRKITKNDLC